MAQHRINKQKKENERKKNSKKKRKWVFMMMVHGGFVVDLNDSSIFDEFLEYVDLINVFLEINQHLLFEMMLLMNLKSNEKENIFY
jgi:hypothetical protein